METLCFSMYSDMSTRIRPALYRTASASALESSVFPTPVGPRNRRILSDGSGLLIRLCLVLRLLPQLSRLLPGRQRVYGVSAPVLPDVSILLPRDAVPEFSSRWIRFCDFFFCYLQFFVFATAFKAFSDLLQIFFELLLARLQFFCLLKNRRH